MAGNRITITIKDDKGKIDFKECPTGFQLMAAYLILKETLDFHLTLEDLEEVEDGND